MVIPSFSAPLSVVGLAVNHSRSTATSIPLILDITLIIGLSVRTVAFKDIL